MAKLTTSNPRFCVYGDARLGPVADAVDAVEEPVPEPAQHLARQRRERHDLQRLGELQDVEAVAALRPQPGDPPQRREQRQQRRCARSRPARAASRPRRSTPRRRSRARARSPRTPARSRSPRRRSARRWRRSPGTSTRCACRPPAARGSSAPTSTAGRPTAAGSPRCRAEKSSVYGVSMNTTVATSDAGTAHVQGAQQEQHPERGAEEDRPEPQPLRHPRGHRRACAGPSSTGPSGTGSRCSGG